MYCISNPDVVTFLNFSGGGLLMQTIGKNLLQSPPRIKVNQFDKNSKILITSRLDSQITVVELYLFVL